LSPQIVVTGRGEVYIGTRLRTLNAPEVVSIAVLEDDDERFLYQLTAAGPKSDVLAVIPGACKIAAVSMADRDGCTA